MGGPIQAGDAGEAMIDLLKVIGAQPGTALAHYLVGIELRAALRGDAFAYPDCGARYMDVDGEVVVPNARGDVAEPAVVGARGERGQFCSPRSRFSRWTKIEARA